MENQDQEQNIINCEIVPKKVRKTNTPEYNKKYYLEHKAHIINDLLCKVVTCDNCLHLVTKSHLTRHKKTKLCERRKK